MSPGQPQESFGPIVLVIGRHDRIRSPILAAELASEQSRFDVKSAGIEPAKKPLKPIVKQYEDEADEQQFRPFPISASLDDHLKLVVYVNESVKRDAPIIATPADKLTLDVDPIESLEGFDEKSVRDFRDYLADGPLEIVLDELSH